LEKRTSSLVDIEGDDEREGNNLKVFKDFRTENGSSQGQNLAVTVLHVPSSLDSGPLRRGGAAAPRFTSLFVHSNWTKVD